MLKHAVKRLLVLLPAVWLVASVVFLLSKNLPGSASEMQLEATVQSANSRAKAEAYARAYRQLLQRTGQDLPLFYFTVSTAAAPDSLHKILSETERQGLNQFIFRYGNWPQIAAYYHPWLQLKNVTAQLPPETIGKKKAQALVNQLLQEPEPAKQAAILSELRVWGRQMESGSFQRLTAVVQQRFETLVATATPGLVYLPKLQLHGVNNQYHRWFTRLGQGELGFSNRDSRPVTEVLGEALSVTIWLALLAFATIAFLAPQIGLALNRKRNASWRNRALQFFYVLESLPLFVVALFFLTLSSWLGWMYDFPEEVACALVVWCLVLVNLPYLVSQAFAAVQAELSQQYVLTARAKGLADKAVLRRHVFRNSLLAVITSLSELFPALLAGTVVLEVVFSVPGMGRLLVSAVQTRDYDVLAALVLVIGFLKMLSHLVADLLYAVTDPRIRR